MMPELFQRILLPVDFAPVSREAFLLGLRLAHQFHAQVLLLHVIDTKSLEALNALGLALPSEEKSQKKRLNHQARLLARGLLSLPETKGLKITRILREGKPFVEIARTVREEKIDLVVMGSYGGQTADISHIFFGSTAEKIVRTVPCPVLTVPYPFKNLATQVDIKATPSTKKAKKRKILRAS
jgi:nucleotide-binding universal stress UspA family protein